MYLFLLQKVVGLNRRYVHDAPVAPVVQLVTSKPSDDLGTVTRIGIFPHIMPNKWRTIISCVCVFSSHSFWTSSSLDVPAGVTQEEAQDFSSTSLRCVPSFFSREGFSHSFPSSTVKSNFCVLTIQSFRYPPVGHFYFYLLFFK